MNIVCEPTWLRRETAGLLASPAVLAGILVTSASGDAPRAVMAAISAFHRRLAAGDADNKTIDKVSRVQ